MVHLPTDEVGATSMLDLVKAPMDATLRTQRFFQARHAAAVAQRWSHEQLVVTFKAPRGKDKALQELDGERGRAADPEGDDPWRRGARDEAELMLMVEVRPPTEMNGMGGVSGIVGVAVTFKAAEVNAERVGGTRFVRAAGAVALMKVGIAMSMSMTKVAHNMMKMRPQAARSLIIACSAKRATVRQRQVSIRH